MQNNGCIDCCLRNVVRVEVHHRFIFIQLVEHVAFLFAVRRCQGSEPETFQQTGLWDLEGHYSYAPSDDGEVVAVALGLEEGDLLLQEIENPRRGLELDGVNELLVGSTESIVDDPEGVVGDLIENS